MSFEALLQEPVPNGMDFAQLDQLLDLINREYTNVSPHTILAPDDLLLVMRTLYHFDSAQQLNQKKYSQNKLTQVIIYVQICLRDKQCNEQQNACVFALAINCAIKYQKSHSKLFVSLLNDVFAECQTQVTLFDALFRQMYNELNQGKQCNPAVLFIVNQLLHFLFQQRQFEASMLTLIDLCFAQLQYVQLENEPLAEIMSEFLVLCVQKFSTHLPQQLSILCTQQSLLQFIYLFVCRKQSISINLIKSLTIILQYVIKNDIDLYNQEQPLLAQLVLRVLPEILGLLNNLNVQFEQKSSILQLLEIAVQYPYCYGFLSQQAKVILLFVILPELLLTEEDIVNTHDNPSEFYEFIQSIKTSQDSLKGAACAILQHMCQRIDGFAGYVVDLSLELQLYQLQAIETTPIADALCQICPGAIFFNAAENNRFAALLIVLILLSKTVMERKDLRQKIEVYLNLNLKLIKTNVDLTCKCLVVELLKNYLPFSFKNNEVKFKKCLKFCFKLLTKKLKVRVLKLFVVQMMKELLASEEVTYRFEQTITEFIMEICDYTATGDLEPFYEWLLSLLQTCNNVVDFHLDKIMKALVTRVLSAAKSLNNKPLAFQCLNIIDKILEMPYCMKYTASIEPQIIDLTKYVLDNQLYDLIDELLDADSRFIAYTKGLTELIYLIFDNFHAFAEHLTIDSVFRLFSFSTIYATEVMKSKPHWIMNMLKTLSYQLAQGLKHEQLIKLSMLIQIFYQHYNMEDVYIQLTKQFSTILESQIENKSIMSTVYICLFMPALQDPSRLDNFEYAMLIRQASAYLTIAFESPQTVTNYKYIFAICHILIFNSQKLFSDAQTLNDAINTVFQFYLNKKAAFLDKITYQSKIGELDFAQKIASKTNFKLQVTEDDIGQHLLEIDIHKVEQKLEEEYLIQLNMLPIMTAQDQSGNILQFIKYSYPGIFTNLNQADALLIAQIQQIQSVAVDNHSIEMRQIYSIGSSKRKQKVKQVFQAM